MDDFEAEAKVYDYIVHNYLIKALLKDREKLRELKLSRAWDELIEFMLTKITADLTIIKNQLSNYGCRIVLEEILPGNHVHVMYVRRRYEYHGYMLPYVLKARCEDKLLELLDQWRLSING